MAYVLGFFAADGNMIRGSRGNHYISFQINDRDILEKMRKLLDSEHKIATRTRSNRERRKDGYRLQIGSREMFHDLLRLGMVSNKTKVLHFPHVPRKYLRDFVRGYFDGDGYVQFGIYRRRNRKPGSVQKILFSGFVCGSTHFLPRLHALLEKESGIKGGSLHFASGAWRLSFSNLDSLRLHKYMYNNLANDLFLHRKKKVFERFRSGR